MPLYTLESLASDFERHSEDYEKHKKDHEDKYPDTVVHDFNLPQALAVIVREIQLLKDLNCK